MHELLGKKYSKIFDIWIFKIFLNFRDVIFFFWEKERKEKKAGILSFFLNFYAYVSV